MCRSLELRIEREPDKPALHTELGRFFKEAGQPDRALASYQRDTAYKDTIAACNASHKSAGHGFIRFTTPSASPVPNRVWHLGEGMPKVVLVSGGSQTD